jgi:hypothetical protein
MHRLSAFLLGLILILSLGVGSVAHATEEIRCVEASTGMSLDHHDGDADQVPGDADKDYPHHHGGCHGHHVGVPIATDPAGTMIGLGMTPLGWRHGPMAPAPSYAALRPPQA